MHRSSRFMIFLETALPKMVAAPSMAAMVVFIYGFILWTAWISLTKSSFLPTYDFAGLIQYFKLFNNDRWWVACKNLEQGEEAETDCAVICTACGRCASDAPDGLVTIQHNLAVVDYSKNSLASRIAIERCPTGAIVWLDEKSGPIKGVAAAKIVRKGALPVG